MTAIGLIHPCKELVDAGGLKDEAVDRIKDKIFTDLASSRPLSVQRAAMTAACVTSPASSSHTHRSNR